jgi:hypothetical protein
MIKFDIKVKRDKYCRNNQIIMSNLRFLYITINFPYRRIKRRRYTVAFHA